MQLTYRMIVLLRARSSCKNDKYLAIPRAKFWSQGDIHSQ